METDNMLRKRNLDILALRESMLRGKREEWFSGLC